jgi:multidrug efflux pump subunit AcrB
MVPVNSVVGDVRGLGDVPIRSDGTRTIFIRDIGTVTDSSDIETGYALANGRRTVYIPVTKRADTSTLSVVNLVKENIPNSRRRSRRASRSAMSSTSRPM